MNEEVVSSQKHKRLTLRMNQHVCSVEIILLGANKEPNGDYNRSPVVKVVPTQLVSHIAPHALKRPLKDPGS